MSKRRVGSRQEVAAAAAGISVSSARRIDSGRLQPKAAKPRGRRRPGTLAEVWEPLLLPLQLAVTSSPSGCRLDQRLPAILQSGSALWLALAGASLLRIGSLSRLYVQGQNLDQPKALRQRALASQAHLCSMQ